MRHRWFSALLALTISQTTLLLAQDCPEADAIVINEQLNRLNMKVALLKKERDANQVIADVEIFAKAADWIVRHHEFFEPAYAKWTIDALQIGLNRADEMTARTTPWFPREGSTVLGYYSRVK